MEQPKSQAELMEKNRYGKHRLELALKVVACLVFLYLIVEFFTNRSEIVRLNNRIDDQRTATENKLHFLANEKRNLLTHLAEQKNNFQEISRNLNLANDRIKGMERELLLCDAKLDESTRNCTDKTSQLQDENMEKENKITELKNEITSLNNELTNYQGQLQICLQNKGLAQENEIARSRNEEKAKNIDLQPIDREQNRDRFPVDRGQFQERIPQDRERSGVIPAKDPLFPEMKFEKKTFLPLLDNQVANEGKQWQTETTTPKPFNNLFDFQAQKRQGGFFPNNNNKRSL